MRLTSEVIICTLYSRTLFKTVPAILLRSSSGVSGAVGTLTTGLQAVAAFKELFYRLKFLADFARVGD